MGSVQDIQQRGKERRLKQIAKIENIYLFRNLDLAQTTLFAINPSPPNFILPNPGKMRLKLPPPPPTLILDRRD